MRTSRWVIIALAVLTVIVVFVSCQSIGQKPVVETPQPSVTTAPATTETPEPTPSATPSDYALDGIVSGTCVRVENGISCEIDELVYHNDTGLATVVSNSGWLLVTCEDGICTAEGVSAQSLPCVVDGERVFCAEVPEIGRDLLYAEMVQFVRHCQTNADGTRTCPLTPASEIRDGQLYILDVPVVLSRIGNRTAIYAGQASSIATPFDCTGAPDGTLLCE